MQQTGRSNNGILIIIGGATATGKTSTAIRLAQALGTEILSADSRQFYRDMSIGTAKPTEAELAAAPHRFINSLAVTDPYSVGDFERDALACLNKIFENHRTAVLVGGSGLFLRAVYEGLDDFPAISEHTRAEISAGEASGGLPWLQAELRAADPEYFSRVDVQNPARLRRALEVCLETGRPYSSYLNKERLPRPFRTIRILLEIPRTRLYQMIDSRVDAMVDAGLEEEARSLLPYRHLPALQTVGYEEWFEYFDGNIDRETAISKIKQHSRNYAKRQATWFRKHGQWTVFDPENQGDILQYCFDQLGSVR